MSLWISCNACFSSPGPARQLAITNCGHIVCNVCFQRGKQGLCLICKAKCKFSPLSEKSSSDVQILFSDISSVAVKYFSEISKVVKFQTKHQKRLLTHYEQTVERMKEERLEMKLEMQKMSEKIVEQQAYISKLEMTVHSQSARLSSQMIRDVQSANQTQASAMNNFPFSSPFSMSQALCATPRAERTGSDSRGLSHKSDAVFLRSSPSSGRMGSVPLRASSQSHSTPFRASVRELSSGLREPMMSPSYAGDYRRGSTPVFKLPLKFPSGFPVTPP